ncbi:hypothetical protein DSECCO2_233290 [anaerobic digester metagenome]
MYLRGAIVHVPDEGRCVVVLVHQVDEFYSVCMSMVGAVNEMLTMTIPRREAVAKARAAEVVFQTQLVGMALLPSVGSEAELLPQQRDLLAAYGVIVHDLRTIVLECAALEGREVRIGRFWLDMELDSGEGRRHSRTEGHFYGVVERDGPVTITYAGSDGFEMRWQSPGLPGGGCSFNQSAV